MPTEINPELFDPEKLQTRRFVGRLLQSEVRVSQGTGANPRPILNKKTNEPWVVYHHEIDNLSQNLNFAYEREVLPLSGPGTAWTKLVLAYRKLGVVLSNKTIPLQKGRVFEWETTTRTIRNRRTGEPQELTDYIPIRVPTEEEIADAEASRGAARDLVPATTATLSVNEMDEVVWGVLDGMTLTELNEVVGSGYPAIAENPNYMADLKSGQVVRRLIAANKAKQNEDGTLSVVK